MGCRMDVMLAGMKTTLISLYISIRALGWWGSLSMSSNTWQGIFFFWAVGLNVVVVQSLNRVQLFVIPCSMPGFPVFHYLMAFPLIHVHWVSIWTSHPLLPSSPFAFHLFQHQGLFQQVSSMHQVAKVLALQILIRGLKIFSKPCC